MHGRESFAERCEVLRLAFEVETISPGRNSEVNAGASGFSTLPQISDPDAKTTV